MMILTKLTDAKDEIDIFLQKQCFGMIGHNISETVINRWGETVLKRDNIYKKYFPLVLEGIISLMKANSHRRKYIDQEQQAIKEILAEVKDLKGSSDRGFAKLDIKAELDSFLFQIKAGLDTFAKTLNPLYEIKQDGWHKKDGKSGLKVLNSLKNLPKEQLNIAADLIEFIESEIDSLTYIVVLRDAPAHKGGLKNITDFIYTLSDQKVIVPHIIHNDGSSEKVSDFMLKTMNYIATFANGFIGLSITNLMPGTRIVIDDNGEVNWGIKQEAIRNGEDQEVK